jgi:predicted nucleic acid-binding protein
MGLTLLDTGVVIGFLDAGDPFHRQAHDEITRLLAGGGFFCVSAVTYAELLAGVWLGHHPEELVEGFVHDFGVEVIPVDALIAAHAAEIRSGHTETTGGGRRRPAIKLPDALILATAATNLDIGLLVVADRRWAKVDVDVELRLLHAA